MRILQYSVSYLFADGRTARDSPSTNWASVMSGVINLRSSDERDGGIL